MSSIQPPCLLRQLGWTSPRPSIRCTLECIQKFGELLLCFLNDLTALNPRGTDAPRKIAVLWPSYIDGLQVARESQVD